MLEQSPLLTREKVLRDPIHDYIYVQHQVILDLINTKEFQRLRRIKQLGTTSLTFHGAEHSRFTHSVGVYEITRRICDNFQRNYPTKEAGDGLWDDSEKLVALCAALLHDIGHGPYSHTFEHIFKTDHEAITAQILTDPSTEINQVLAGVSTDFPAKVASVIQKKYPNPQVVQLISSQIDADRMDYLLRDSYYTGTNYGTFDLTRILRVMRPYKGGIAFDINGMHAVEDYIVSRFQMYVQVYFHPISRSMEVILSHLLHRAKYLYENNRLGLEDSPKLLIPLFENDFSLDDYLQLDDGVLTTYFTEWRQNTDTILSDLAVRFLDRKPFKSIKFDANTADLLPDLERLIESAGFNPEYYTAENDSYDLPYDAYDPTKDKPRTQIELAQEDGSLVELSSVSDLVASITGKVSGDRRFFFPRELLKSEDDLFVDIYNQFRTYINNDNLIHPKEITQHDN
ncbi:HD domain-containing protein [Dellaglioa algida]|uniref:HD domain protein n=1 Tax=Dellaglioa algida DSM 15638 TaxID=1423719 RepID=A0A0R1HG87_9LACO|nr:HD domain-containing protein [Dellaglioa algida]KRK45430.1 HD domain protein [Dellaglioa algida DSM 15638]MDK1733037.1 HD domain-containing protein [Dellaglioa algida]MDK1734515.1 HD domain-containing protein [Dellaglioa algida]